MNFSDSTIFVISIDEGKRMQDLLKKSGIKISGLGPEERFNPDRRWQYLDPKKEGFIVKYDQEDVPEKTDKKELQLVFLYGMVDSDQKKSKQKMAEAA